MVEVLMVGKRMNSQWPISEEERFKRATACRPALLAVILAMTRDYQEAEDLVQETMLEVFKSADRFDESRDFLRWAKGIARNVVMRHWAAQQRQPALMEAEALQTLAEALMQEDEEPARWEQERRRLQECLDRLSERSRKLFLLRYGNNLKGHALSEASGYNFNSLRTTLLRIRAFLRECIRRGASAMEEHSGV